jgi:membrane-bound serine protease (ClpP class)
MIRTTTLLLALLLAAAGAETALAGESAVIPLKGRLGPTQADRTGGEIRRLSDLGYTTLLLDLALDSADDTAGLALAKAVAAAPEALTVGVLVSRAAPGSAVAVVLAADRAFMLPEARLGPVPPVGPVRQRLVAMAGERGIPLTAIHRLLEPQGLPAEDARELRLVDQVCVARAEVLTTLGIDPALAEEHRSAQAEALRPGPGNPRVKGPFTRVFLIPIDREIDTTLATSVERRIGLAVDAGADLILFEVDSPGGLVSASMDIGDLVFDCKVPTVMLIFREAYSGAALVSLAGNAIIMGEGGIVGDCQPIAIGPEGYQVLGEKIQSPLRALFRKFAERNGYPVALAEAMVTEQMAVERVTFEDGAVLYLSPEKVEEQETDHGPAVDRKTIVTAKELFTMHAGEAFEYGFCGEPVKTREAAFRRLDLREGDVTRLEESWAEETSRFLLAIKLLLFFCGITALYMELKVAGFGVPGAIALICFTLFFSASAIAGITTGLEVVLFLLGVLLLILEIFVIPGFGVTGLGGFLLLLASLYMASEKYPFPTPGRVWGAETPINWFLQFAGAGVAAIVAVALIARYLPHTGLGRRVILAPAGPPGSQGLTGSGSAAIPTLSGLVGRRGVAVTPLRPAGRIEVGGEPWDAVTEGSFVAPGAPVRVLRTQGNRIVVEEA